jgi:hypothetical protein
LTAAEPAADASSAEVPVAAVAAAPAAAVKAKNRFPLTIAPLWSQRRDRGAPGTRGAYARSYLRLKPAAR